MKILKMLHNCLRSGRKPISYLLAFFASLFILILFSGCENFMNGDFIKNELEGAIDYANAPVYEVLVTADEGTGTIIIGSGNNKVKVTDSFEVSFRKASGYKFVRWTAVSRDGKKSMDDFVSFENITELNTKVTLKNSSSDIQIKPLCEASLSVEESYPEFKEEGVARDSSIKLLLTAPLSDKNDLSRITIDIDNSNVKGSLYFNDPEIVDNQLVITAKASNRIAVTEGTIKTVTVTIPADFLYVGVNGEFEIGEELQHIYRINSTTRDKAFITYGTSEENAGIIKVNGIAAPAVTQQYSIGESVTVSYKVADGYFFKGWKCSDEGAILKIKPEDDLYDENGYNETTKTATILLRIINETKNAVFGAIVEKIPTVSLKFNTSSENSGIIKVNGVTYGGEEKEYRLGDEITLTFKKGDEYLFQGITENNDIYTVEYAEQDTDSFGYDAETKTATIKLTIVAKTTKTDVQTVTLKTPEIPWTEINVSSPYGRFSSDASRIYRVGEKQTISFTSDPDYQFIRWQVVDLNNGGQEISGWENYIDFSDEKNSNMTYTLKKAPENSVKLGIVPMCAKRPKIVSYSPQYSTAGDMRDRTLVIMFNTKMHESSIYYSGDELVELGVVNKIGGKYVTKAEYDLLGKLADGDCYGYYKKADPENSIVFKNIRICKLNNQSVNLLKYYEKPVFDKGNTGILRIPTKITDENKDEAPPKYSEILVTIENGINTLVGDVNVKLSEEFAWAYYTNTKTDSAPPEISSIDIKLSNESAKNSSDVDGNKSLKGFTTTLLTASTDNIETYNAKEDHIWVKLNVNDAGSGVDTVYGTFTKLHNKYYPNESGQDEILDTKIHFELGGSALSSIIDENVNLKEYGLTEGLYSISFEATDKNEHKTYSDFAYQFVYDNVAPEKISEVKEVRNAADRTTLTWKNPFERDFAKVKVLAHNEDDIGRDIEKWYTVDTSNYTFETVYDNIVNGLTNQKHYSYTVSVVDYAGNESEVTRVEKDTEAPSKLENLTEIRTRSGKATVSWTKPTEPDFERIEIVRKNATANTASVKDDIPYTAVNNTTYDVEDFNRYEYTAKVYDFSGNASEAVIYTDEEAPAKLTGLAESRTVSGKANVSWIKPAEPDFGKIEIVRKNATANTAGVTDNISYTAVSNTTYDVEDFNRYEYTAKVYDFSGNVSEETVFTDEEVPAKVTGLEEDRTSRTEARVSWTVPEKVGKVSIKRYDSNNVLKDEFEVPRNKNYQDYANLENGIRYIYKVTTIDYSGNTNTESVDYTDITPPANVTGVTNSRLSADSETITWTRPSDEDYDHVRIVQYDTENNEKIAEVTLEKSTNSKTFEGLTNQHKYNYRIYASDFAGNETTTYISYQDDVAPTSLINVSNISNSRTSANNESVSWSANPSGSDVDHIIIKQYDGTTLNNTFTQNSTSTKTASFSGLINQHKYKYRFYSVDYSGNVSTNYTEYQDNVGPTSLINISNISNSRTSENNESVSWSANPSGSDVDHIIIKQYDGTILNNTFTQNSTSTKTASFSGLINQHKYKYRFYSVDYSGNMSTNYTEYQDNKAPGKLTIRYSEGRNGKVNVFFTTPSDEDYYRTTVSWEENSKQYGMEESYGSNKSSYKSFGGATNWTLYNYYFRTYDYSGNCSEYVYLQEMGGAMPGMICYAPGNSSGNVFCSINKWEGKNPIGIVADGSDQSKVKILELDRSNKYVYGPNEPKTSFCADNTYKDNVGKLWIAGGFNATYNLTDGIDWWKLVRDNSKYQENNTSNSIWAYLKQKNKDSPAVTWWVPAVHEWQYVCVNWEAMCSGFNTLGVPNKIYVGDLFYVSTPNWYHNRCNLVGIGTDYGGKLNEYLAYSSWMKMYTNGWSKDYFYRDTSYGAYVRAMAFVDMR